MPMQQQRYSADWWITDYDTSWERVKSAFSRDWEQTKHDFGGAAPDLNQGASDTVSQATGRKDIPAGNQPNFEDFEPGFRFGHGARMHYQRTHPSWNDQLEATLQKDWGLSGDNADWGRFKPAVRSGYTYTENKTTDTITP